MTLSLAEMLSENYASTEPINLILAHQYLAQLEPKMRDAISGNVESMISFRNRRGRCGVGGAGILFYIHPYRLNQPAAPPRLFEANDRRTSITAVQGGDFEARYFRGLDYYEVAVAGRLLLPRICASRGIVRGSCK